MVASANVSAGATCSGKILDVVKWSGSEDLSILLENTGRYIKFVDKTAISMALTAFSAQKNVAVHMSDPAITTCNEGWAHYTVHAGYFRVDS